MSLSCCVVFDAAGHAWAQAVGASAGFIGMSQLRSLTINLDRPALEFSPTPSRYEPVGVSRTCTRMSLTGLLQFGSRMLTVGLHGTTPNGQGEGQFGQTGQFSQPAGHGPTWSGMGVTRSATA